MYNTNKAFNFNPPLDAKSLATCIRSSETKSLVVGNMLAG